jgi:hypothetical protein
MMILNRPRFSEGPSTVSTPDGVAEVKPYQRLEMHEGLIVYPEDAPNPARLPILGLRALVRNRLTLVIDGKRREVTLKTSGWF